MALAPPRVMKSELNEILIAVALFVFLAAMGLARYSMQASYFNRLPACEDMASAEENFVRGFKESVPTCRPQTARVGIAP